MMCEENRTDFCIDEHGAVSYMVSSQFQNRLCCGRAKPFEPDDLVKTVRQVMQKEKGYGKEEDTRHR
jgi:hypothetical protein